MARPTILITTSSRPNPGRPGLIRTDNITGQNYSEAVTQAGGLPMLVSNLEPKLADDYLERAGGLLLSGGDDLDPYLYEAEPHPNLGRIDAARDAFEIALYESAKKRGIPVLGVCRGIQVINVVDGGTLHQHLPAVPNTMQHTQSDHGSSLSHRVTLTESSRLAKAYGKTTLKTNTFHHQAVDKVGRGLRASAYTSDGVVEAIEGTGETFVLAVQWHPEMIFSQFPEHHLVFQMFLDAVKERSVSAVAAA